MPRLGFICALGMLVGCSSGYEPAVGDAGTDPAKYKADLDSCRSLAAQGAAGTNDSAITPLASAPIGPLYSTAGGAGSNLAPPGNDQRAIIDSCMTRRGYTLLK